MTEQPSMQQDLWERRLPAGTGAERRIMSRLEAGAPSKWTGADGAA